MCPQRGDLWPCCDTEPKVSTNSCGLKEYYLTFSLELVLNGLWVYLRRVCVGGTWERIRRGGDLHVPCLCALSSDS